MSAGNVGQTKSPSPGGGASIPSPTTGTGGTSPQNSPPAFSHTISDIGPSLSVPSVSPLSPTNSKDPGPGSGDTSIAPPNPIPPQPSVKPPVTSIPPVLPSQQTPSQMPPPATLPTPANPQTTTFPPPSTPSSTTEPSHGFPSPPDSAHGPSQTTTSAPMTSSSLEGSIPSVLSSILSPIETHNSAKSSATPFSFPVPTDSATPTSKQNGPQTTTSAPTLTSSSQGGFIPSALSSILSPIEPQNPPKSSTTPFSFSDPTATSTPKQNDPQTTPSAPPLTSSSQEGSIPSILSSILSPIEPHNPTKSSATPSSSPVPTDPATSTSKHDDPQTTASAPTPTSPSQEGSITPASSSPSDKPAKSSATTSSALTNDPQTLSGEAPSPSPSSIEGSPPTTHTDKTYTQTTATSNPPAPEPTGYSGSPNTASPTTVAGGSPTTVPGAKTPESQSPSGNPTNSPSPVVKLASTSSGGSHPAFESPSESSTTNNSEKIISTSYKTTFISSGTDSVGSSVTSTITSWVPTTTVVGGSRARSNSGSIVGGVVGGILALLVLSIAGCYVIRRRRYQQQLHDRDLTAPLSPEAIETMRETHPYRPTYDFVGGQVMSESRDNIHRASSSESLVASAFAFPRPIAEHSSLQSHVRNSSGSMFYENVSVSNDGYGSSGEESEGTERDFASAQSLYTSNDWQSSESVGVGIAIGSETSVDLHSYHTAVTRLAPVSRTPVDDDEELESPGPSPSSFPAPPNSISMNPFLDAARIAGYPGFEASRALYSGGAVSASSEAATPNPKEQASWTAAVAAASSADAQTPKATQSLNPFTEERYVVNVSSDSSSENTTMPTQSAPLITPLNPSFIVNPFLRETSQEGFSDDSRSSESHETISIPYAYSDPFEFRDKGKGKAQTPANLMVDTKHNRLSNASSGLEFPENPSQCGLAL